MEFGTKYKDIAELVAILEQHLGITMAMDDDSETGVSYDWATEPDEQGFSWYVIYVQPTRIFDQEERRVRLRRTYWKPYTFVIGVSDELAAHIARLRDLIRQGILLADEIHYDPIG